MGRPKGSKNGVRQKQPRIKVDPAVAASWDTRKFHRSKLPKNKAELVKISARSPFSIVQYVHWLNKKGRQDVVRLSNTEYAVMQRWMSRYGYVSGEMRVAGHLIVPRTNDPVPEFVKARAETLIAERDRVVSAEELEEIEQYREYAKRK